MSVPFQIFHTQAFTEQLTLEAIDSNCITTWNKQLGFLVLGTTGPSHILPK